MEGGIVHSGKTVDLAIVPAKNGIMPKDISGAI
jgi:hypothetical protein